MSASQLSIPEAALALHAGKVIAYPTEAVWGLGCDPRDEQAVLRLLAIKQRDVDKGLILIGSRLEQLHAYLDMAAVPAQRLAEVLASWPGPHTWIMPPQRAPRGHGCIRIAVRIVHMRAGGALRRYDAPSSRPAQSAGSPQRMLCSPG